MARLAPTAAASPSAAPVVRVGAPVSVDSFSLVSTRTGYALGSAACGTRRCAVLSGTRDGGVTWSSRTAPPSTDDLALVRFADASTGYAVTDTGLWLTEDGARSWQPVVTRRPVRALETDAGRVFAVEQDCATPCDGPARLLAGPVADDLAVVPGLAPEQVGGLTVHGEAVFVTGAERREGRASLWASADGRGFTRRGLPCDATVDEVEVTAADERRLVLVCADDGAAPSSKELWTSGDAGGSWQRRADPPLGGRGPLVATGTAVFQGGQAGIGVTRNLRRWSTMLPELAGFAQLGLVDEDLGLVAGPDALYRTTDSGRTWRSVPVRVTAPAAGPSPRPTLVPGVAGACATASGSRATVQTSPDGLPVPRCLRTRLRQRLTVDDPLPSPVTARLSTGQVLEVPGRERRTFPGTLGDLVGGAGRYRLQLGPGSAELLVEE